MKKNLTFLTLIGCFCISMLSAQTPFTQGNIVVLRVGDGSAALTSAAQPVFLDEYAVNLITPGATLVQTVALPIADNGANQTLTLGGTSTAEGALTLSPNGQYLSLAGYDAIPGTASVASSAIVDRIMGLVSANGTVNTTTGITAGTGYNANSIRGAVTTDGTGFWCAGAGASTTGGTRYVTFGSVSGTSVQMSNTLTNTRVPSIFGGQLYVTSASGTFQGITAVGTGVPTTAGALNTLLPGFPTATGPSPYGFQMFDLDASVPGVDVAYVADDRTTTAGGIQKWSLVGGTWVLNGTINLTGVGVRGLTARQTCLGIVLIASSNNSLATTTDAAGYNAAPSNLILVPFLTSATNTVFRGIAAAPSATAPSALAVSISTTNPTCGTSTGSATAAVTGGIGSNYTYLWSNGITTANNAGIAQGNYTVTVSDALGCTATASTTISGPQSISLSSIQSTNASCFGASNGTLTANATGGSSYTYSWSGTSQTTQTVTGLAAGTYNITVSAAGGCTASGSGTVSQPAILAATQTATASTCGLTNGAVSLNVSGGNTPYTFTWSNGVTNQNINNLAGGTYTVTVNSATGCTTTASSIVATSTPVTVGSMSNNNVSCFGGNNGSVSVNPTGSATYTYVWSGTTQTTATVTGLTAGTYNVTVTGNTGCTATGTRTVSQPSTALSVSGMISANVSCFGGNNGSAMAMVSGGTGAYAYNWNTSPVQTTQTATALTAGNHAVTVTDANGCTAATSMDVTQPTAVTVTSNTTSSTCGQSNGTVNLTVSGGNTPYTYNWSNGQTAQNLANVSAGNYTVTVTTPGACTTTASATVGNNSSFTASITSTNVTCNNLTNGTASVTTSGGTMPYTYNWGGGITTSSRTGLAAGTYPVTVTDASGCISVLTTTITQPTAVAATYAVTDLTCANSCVGGILSSPFGGLPPYNFVWSNGATTQNINNLCMGNYSVTITDTQGCAHIRLNINVEAPPAIMATANTTNVSCAGLCNGSVSLNVMGGTAPYNYVWSNGTTTSPVSGLCAGTYTPTITDAAGCTFTPSASFTVTQPTALTVTATVVDASVNGGSDGSVTPQGMGGTAPYTFSGGGQNLTAGTYTVTATDSNGCTATATFTVGEPNGIGQIENINSLSVAPNPTDADVTLNIDLKNAEDISVSVYASNGQLISQNIFGKTQSITQTIQLNTLPAGMYMLKINIGNDLLTKRVLKF